MGGMGKQDMMGMMMMKGKGKPCFKGKGKGGGCNDVMQELGQFFGSVKSYNEATGYGFITCPDLQAQGFTSDVFLSKQHRGEFSKGAEVAFTCYLNSKGQPQARDLQ